MRYAQWAGLRLPSEAEWDRAAVWDGDKARIFPWGDQADFDGRASIVGLQQTGRDFDGLPNHLEGTRQNAAGASPVGALNMLGNAAEWVLDFYDSKAYKKYHERRHEGVKDPLTLLPPKPSSRHVLRGSCFLHCLPEARAASRSNPEVGHHDGTGFRVALSAVGATREWESQIAEMKGK